MSVFRIQFSVQHTFETEFPTDATWHCAIFSPSPQKEKRGGVRRPIIQAKIPSPRLDGERIPRNENSRIEPLNRSSRRESALTSLWWIRWSGLTSAATRFMGREPATVLNCAYSPPVTRGQRLQKSAPVFLGQFNGHSLARSVHFQLPFLFRHEPARVVDQTVNPFVVVVGVVVKQT